MAYFHGPDDPVYTISVAARLLGVTPQFLRQIEGEGLISPARTDSNIRLYSDNDLRLLAKIIYLWRDCGINPQGVRVIIAMEEGDLSEEEIYDYQRIKRVRRNHRSRVQGRENKKVTDDNLVKENL